MFVNSGLIWSNMAGVLNTPFVQEGMLNDGADVDDHLILVQVCKAKPMLQCTAHIYTIHMHT